MMSYDQFNMIFYIGLIMAVVFLAVSVLLLFVLKIPSVIGELSGITARKAISEIRKNNAEGHTRSASGNKSGVKITDNMSQTSGLSKSKLKSPINGVTTASLAPKGEKHSSASKTEQPKKAISEETAVLHTGVKPQEGYSEETAVLYDDMSRGTIVSEDAYTEQTTVLGDETVVLTNYADSSENVDFRIVAEVVLFVSPEIIA